MGAGKRLKEVRLISGLTQNNFGEKIDLKFTQVGDIEREKQQVSVDLAEKIQEIFHINPWWLLTGKGEMTYFENEKNCLDLNNLEFLRNEMKKAIDKLPEHKTKKFFHLMMAELEEIGN